MESYRSNFENGKNYIKSTKSGSSFKKSVIKNGLFVDFLKYMDTSAIHFSHLSYEESIISLNNAEKVLKKIEERMSDILNTRSGTLVCDNNNENSGGSADSLNISNNNNNEIYFLQNVSNFILKIIKLSIQFSVVFSFIYGGIKIGNKLKSIKDEKRKQYL